MKRGLLIAGWVLALVGPLMLVAAGIGFQHERAFIRRASTAQAVVVEMVEKRGNDGPTFAPVYVFHDNSGQEQKIYSRTSSYPPAYRVGDKITVLYDRQAPQDAQIHGFFDMWGWMTIVASMGISYCVIGPVLLVVARKRKQESANQLSKTVT